ncbi:hypothetical protein ACT7CV_29705 [Bacillus paranthracis]
MATLKETTYIEMNTYNEIGFFKGIVWGLVFVVPFLEYYDNSIYLAL